jgi:hypothetical protein
MYQGEWTRDNRISTRDGYFWRLDRLCVPPNFELRLRLIYELHDSGSTCHKRVGGSLAKVIEKFWWKQIRQDVKHFYERFVVSRQAQRFNRMYLLLST